MPVHDAQLALAPGAMVLRAFAVEEAPALLAAIDAVAQVSPWRHMSTARGWRMSVAMTNCGDAGWVSDRSGYRYDAIDPQTQRPWPALPSVFTELAVRAADAAGFTHFAPDARDSGRSQVRRSLRSATCARAGSKAVTCARLRAVPSAILCGLKEPQQGACD